MVAAHHFHRANMRRCALRTIQRGVQLRWTVLRMWYVSQDVVSCCGSYDQFKANYPRSHFLADGYPSLDPLRSVQSSSVQFSSVRMMLVGVWFGLYWVSCSFFDYLFKVPFTCGHSSARNLAQSRAYALSCPERSHKIRTGVLWFTCGHISATWFSLGHAPSLAPNVATRSGPENWPAKKKVASQAQIKINLVAICFVGHPKQETDCQPLMTACKHNVPQTSLFWIRHVFRPKVLGPKDISNLDFACKPFAKKKGGGALLEFVIVWPFHVPTVPAVTVGGYLL